MQELARLPEILAHLEQNAIYCPGKTSPPLGLELLIENLESLGLRPAEYPPPPPKMKIWSGLRTLSFWLVHNTPLSRK